jgi:hypothetical protein
MFIGAYLCTGGFVYLAVLLWLVLWAGRDEKVGRFRKRILSFSLLSFALVGLGLLLFLGGSLLTGVLRVGEPQEYRLPQAYLELGLSGVLVLVVAALGLLSPLFAAYKTRKTALS